MDVYLEVYGCTANKADASLIKGLIRENKIQITDKVEQADVIIILTCTVIDTTEQRMLSRLRFFSKTGKRIIVGGCMASIQKDIIRSVVTNVDLLPPQYSHHIIDILKNKKTEFIEKDKTKSPKDFKDVTAPISISEGCSFSCTYCITHLARGKLRSYTIDEIKQDIYSAIYNGCKEIQLTAQDTSSFGLDKKHDLGELLKEVSDIKRDFRIRVGMMNPYTCLKHLSSIINGFKDQKIYRFLHLPVQSGDDNILHKMNRKYVVTDFKKIIKDFKKCYPNITLATDVIVGFPTETEKQFQNTIDLIKKIKPDITNITRFSARPYTKAKTMKGRIDTSIVKQRSKRLSQLCKKISLKNNQQHIGKKYSILITEKGKNKSFVGRTENYKPVVLIERVKIGEVIPVKILDAYPTYLVGTLI